MAEETEKTPEEQLKEQYDHEPEPLHTPPAKETPEPPKTPRKHPAALVRLAMKHGATRDAIEQASQNDLLEWVEEQEIQRERDREQNLRQSEAQRVVQTQVSGSPAKPAEDEIDWGTDEDGRRIEEKDILPGLRNLIKRQQKELKELKGGFEETTKREQARASQIGRDRIEDGFAGLEDRYQQLFGSGTLADCTPAQQKCRIAVLKSLGIDTDNAPSQKLLSRKIAKEAAELNMIQDKEPEDESYAASANLPATQPNGKARITEKQFEDGTLTRVSNRVPKEEKGKKLAYKRVAEKMTELKMNDDYFNNFESDGMPE